MTKNFHHLSSQGKRVIPFCSLLYLELRKIINIFICQYERERERKTVWKIRLCGENKRLRRRVAWHPCRSVRGCLRPRDSSHAARTRSRSPRSNPGSGPVNTQDATCAFTSVADPDPNPDPSDPYVFEHPDPYIIKQN
jgi:hypothetical protein